MEEIRALDRVTDALEAANSWTPVTERLPEQDSRVLVVYGESEIMNVLFCDHARPLPNTVTHWRELPAPPQEVK